MTWLEFVRGALLILFIAAIAGAVAYVGDRVGHQVGRKRLTLFNIRPKYTSTIVAVATGVLIALAVTLVALLLSADARSAFFQIGSLKQQIRDLNDQEAALEQKVSNQNLVLGVGAPVYPQIAVLQPNMSADERYKTVKNYYTQVVQWVNSVYVTQGLREYQPPKNVDALLHQVADVRQQFGNTDAPILVAAVADRNLYAGGEGKSKPETSPNPVPTATPTPTPGDRIDFDMQPTLDVQIIPARTAITTLEIQNGKGVDLGFALQQLQHQVATDLVRLHMPSFFLGAPYFVQAFPQQADMQKQLAAGGRFALTAYTAEALYPHTAIQTRGVTPMVVVLSRQ